MLQSEWILARGMNIHRKGVIMGEIISKYRLCSFYLATMIFSILLFVLHIVFPDVGKYSVSFTQLSPVLAVVFMAWVLKDREILGGIRRKLRLETLEIRWLIPAVAVPFICITISSAVLTLQKVEFVPWQGNLSFYSLSFTAMLIGCAAEEIGWRGFLLPELQKRHTPFLSSIILGLLWGVWHLNFTGGLAGFLLYTVTIVEMSILMTWLYNRTNGNLVLMILWHLTFNISSHFFLWNRFGIKMFMVESIVFGLACILILSVERYRESLKHRRSSWDMEVNYDD